MFNMLLNVANIFISLQGCKTLFKSRNANIYHLQEMFKDICRGKGFYRPQEDM